MGGARHLEGSSPEHQPHPAGSTSWLCQHTEAPLSDAIVVMAGFSAFVGDANILQQGSKGPRSNCSKGYSLFFSKVVRLSYDLRTDEREGARPHL